MRKLFSVLAVSALALAGAGQASAGALTSSSLTFQVGALPPASFTGSATGSYDGTTATVNAGNAFNGTFTTTIPSTAAPPLSAIQVKVTKNAAGSFSGSPFGGTMAIEGIANVKAFGGVTLLGVPLKIGTPNTITPPTAYGINITAIAAGWTTGVVTVMTDTGTQAAVGTNNLTVGGGGTVTLVTPVTIKTNIAGILAAFGALTLTFVPEPGTLLLLGAGVAGLAMLGRRRM